MPCRVAKRVAPSMEDLQLVAQLIELQLEHKVYLKLVEDRILRQVVGERDTCQTQWTPRPTMRQINPQSLSRIESRSPQLRKRRERSCNRIQLQGLRIRCLSMIGPLRTSLRRSTKRILTNSLMEAISRLSLLEASQRFQRVLSRALFRIQG